MTRPALFVSVFLSIALVAFSYYFLGYLVPAAVLMSLGLAWMVGLSRRWAWASIFGLFIVYGFASAGFFLDSQATGHASSMGINLITLLLLSGGLFALFAWDLTDFSTRLHRAAENDDLPSLERRHFLRILPVMVLGLAASILALAIRINISFEWMIIVVLVGMIGASRLINRLLRSN